MTPQTPARTIQRAVAPLALLGATLTLSGCLSGTPGPIETESASPTAAETTQAPEDTPSETTEATESATPEADSTPTEASEPTSSAPAGDAPPGDHNEADVNYAASLMTGFEESVDLVEIAQTQSQNEKLLSLAKTMGMLQSKQLPLLAGWIQAWGGPTGEGTKPSHDPSKYTSLTGAAFDRAWVTRQLALHDKTIALSKAVIAEGKNPGLVGHAKRVLSVAQRERATLSSLPI